MSDSEQINTLLEMALRRCGGSAEQAATALAVATGRMAERGGVALARVQQVLGVAYDASAAVGDDVDLPGGS
jgi:hypothetical protein